MLNKTLLITGSAGFLGTNLWQRLENKCALVGLDKYSYASTTVNPKKVLYVDKVNYGFTYKGDCTNLKA